MCGLIYGHRKGGHRINKAIRKRYYKQNGRGTEGFGYVAIKNGKIINVQRATNEKSIIKSLKSEDAEEILFHHRLPTSTENVEDATHPIVVDNRMLDKKYYVIHNGGITNDKILKEEHEKLGFEYTTLIEEVTTTQIKTRSGVTEVSHSKESFNDSEALAIDLALYLDGKQDRIKALGAISFICLQTTKRGKVEKIYYGRNLAKPLVVERDKNNKMLFIKSEGTGTELYAHTLYCIDHKTQKVTMEEVDIGYNYKGKMGYGYDWEKDDRGIKSPMSGYLPGGNRRLPLSDSERAAIRNHSVDPDDIDYDESTTDTYADKDYEREWEEYIRQEGGNGYDPEDSLQEKIQNLYEAEEQIRSDIRFIDNEIKVEEAAKNRTLAKEWKEERKKTVRQLNDLRNEIKKLETQEEWLYGTQ